MERRARGCCCTARDREAFTLVELLVVMCILMILSGIVFAVVRAVYLRSLDRTTRADIEIIEIGLAKYRQDWGAYPPDDIVPIGGSAENGTNEALVYHLCRKVVAGVNTYGPYSQIGEGRFGDSDGDGFRELRDPCGGLYRYAENASHAAPTGANPRSFDIVSPGPDGELGGTMSPATGYVPAATPEAKKLERDNVTNW